MPVTLYIPKIPQNSNWENACRNLNAGSCLTLYTYIYVYAVMIVYSFGLFSKSLIKSFLVSLNCFSLSFKMKSILSWCYHHSIYNKILKGNELITENTFRTIAKDCKFVNIFLKIFNFTFLFRLLGIFVLLRCIYSHIPASKGRKCLQKSLKSS